MVYPTKAKVNLEDSVHQLKPTMKECDDTHNTSLILLLDFTGIPIFYGIYGMNGKGTVSPDLLTTLSGPNQTVVQSFKARANQPNQTEASLKYLR